MGAAQAQNRFPQAQAGYGVMVPPGMYPPGMMPPGMVVPGFVDPDAAPTWLKILAFTTVVSAVAVLAVFGWMIGRYLQGT